MVDYDEHRSVPQRNSVEGQIMAAPVGFEGANTLISGEAMGCNDLETFRTETEIISCWRLSAEELEIVAATGVVWLSVWGGGQPPVLISGKALVNIGDRPSKAEPVIPKRIK